MIPSLPVCADLAWWVDAWLRDDVALADVLHRASLHTPVHSSVSIDRGPWSQEGTDLAQLLIELHDAGAARAACALPVPARLHGLAGPASLNRAALDAGQALLLLGRRPGEVVAALVPHRAGAGTSWAVHRASPRPPGDVGEADRQLRRTVLAAGEALAQLGVASWSPDVADVLLNLERPPTVESPPGVPEHALGVASRATWLMEVIEAALEDGDGGAVTAQEAAARHDALQVLDDAARSALVAACSADAWP